MSIHEAKVIQIKEILPHPDPETVRLGLVKVWDYQCVVGKDLWKVGDLAVYIEPDTMVDGNKPEFAFLNGTKPPQIHRIKAKRLRGTWSEGLLVPAPEGLKEGDDAWEVLGLARYVPTISRGKGSGRAANLDSEFGMGGEAEEAPIRLPFSKYDIENFKKYNSILVENEIVVVTEKIHGCNGRFLWADGRMWAGSRSHWKRRPELKTVETPDGPKTYMPKDNVWWQALDQNSWIEELCKALPNHIVFGEVFGQVQDLKYGAKQNEIFFRVFDIWSHEKKEWLSFHDIFNLSFMKDKEGRFLSLMSDAKHAPVLYIGPYSKEKIFELTDGSSRIDNAGHIREGVVVKPTTERIDARHGRVILKNVSNLYLERP